MANLAIVGSHSTNGVAAIHSELLRTMTVKDFAELFPERFNNKTNGVTPRRWLLLANPALAETITEAIGDGWITDLGQLEQARAAGRRRGASQDAFRKAKREAKTRFADWLEAHIGQTVDPDTIFDCQIKRIHEYKRQLLNALHIVVLYNRLRENPQLEMPPRTFFFAGKAAPAYHLAKLIIKFINNLAGTIDGDPADARPAQGRVPARLLRLAGRAADPGQRRLQPDLDRRLRGQRHQQHEVHDERRADHRHARRRHHRDGRGGRRGELLPVRPDRRSRWPSSRGWYNPQWHYDNEPETRAALDLIFSDHFSRDEPGIFAPMRDTLLTHGDHYMHLADLESYREADQRLGELYADPERLGAQGDPERRRLRQVLERPHHRRVRGRYLGRGAVPCLRVNA